MKNILFIGFLLLAFQGYAQVIVEGKVYEKDTQIPLVGANVYWAGTNYGVATDQNGIFQLVGVEGAEAMVVSYVGYANDTTALGAWFSIEIPMRPISNLNEIEIVHRQKSSSISFINPIKVVQITEKELLKAACCNLSESFETTPSVDVSFTDAVTGTRQIQLLGLAGPYTQITRESMPDVRGLSAVDGLTYTPGPWVKSIQLNKGTGTVVNGFESIAGQINVELRKPENEDRLYLNLYANQGSRVELNANVTHRFKKNWSMATLLHGKTNPARFDMNKDGFLDKPIGTNFIGVNRWKYIGPKSMRLQLGVKGTVIDNIGGEKDFSCFCDGQDLWGMSHEVQRIEGWGKMGFVFEETPWKTVGFQVSATHHNEDDRFGNREHDAKQTSLYGNLIYQSIFNNTNHSFKTGASIQTDNYQESFSNRNFDRKEMVSGAFFEYTYLFEEKFSLVAGIRGDYHNIYGAFATPRLHLRWAITEDAVLRASAGRGQRTANLITENMGLLASSREFVFVDAANDKPFGMEAEVAWNYGVNFTQSFRLFQREASASVDFYRTDFQNQIVVDIDADPQTVYFYNLQGESFSNSFQTQVDMELLKNFDVRVAYRWFDVRTTYASELSTKPLIAPHRAFINLAYKTENDWNFDFTANWQSKKRLPSTVEKPVQYQLAAESPDFVLLKAQVSKGWQGKYEVYAGMENILNTRQTNPILASEDPFGEHFDASIVWGPIFGRMTYVGFRYRIAYK